MSRVTRRTFFSWLGAALPALALAKRLDAALANGLEAAPVRALAVAILPSELGPSGIEQAADGFCSWAADFHPGAELLHDYGVPKIPYAGLTPVGRWTAQLSELDAQARRRHDTPWVTLDVEKRRVLVRERLAAEKKLEADLPADPARAPHVAVALLAYWYGLPEATDLCYGAAIGKLRCRPLMASSAKPLPLATP